MQTLRASGVKERKQKTALAGMLAHISQGCFYGGYMERKEYNGWVNRATWNVALWLDNDEGLYGGMQAFMKHHKGDVTPEDAKRFCVGIFENQKTPDGIDLKKDDVEWKDIAEVIQESI